jgi:hypothetical protein
MNKVMTEVYGMLQIRKIWISPHRPQANGMVERFNGTLKMILRLLCEDYLSDWVQYLQPAVFSYNTSAAEAIGTSPYAALYGREAHFPFSVSYSMGGSAGAKPFEEFKMSQDKYLRGAHHFIQAMLDKSHLDVVAKSMQHARINAFVPGDLVWLRNAFIWPVPSTTLQFDGPFRVLRRSGDVNYFIERVSPRKSEKEIMVHVSRLKKCVLKSTIHPSAGSATSSSSPPAELLYETPVAESTPTSADLPFLPPTHTSVRIPSEPRRPRRVAAPKKSPIEAPTESTTESSSAPLVEEKTDTSVSSPSSSTPVPTPPVADPLADLAIVPMDTSQAPTRVLRGTGLLFRPDYDVTKLQRQPVLTPYSLYSAPNRIRERLKKEKNKKNEKKALKSK